MSSNSTTRSLASPLEILTCHKSIPSSIENWWQDLKHCGISGRNQKQNKTTTTTTTTTTTKTIKRLSIKMWLSRTMELIPFKQFHYSNLFIRGRTIHNNKFPIRMYDTLYGHVTSTTSFIFMEISFQKQTKQCYWKVWIFIKEYWFLSNLLIFHFECLIILFDVSASSNHSPQQTYQLNHGFDFGWSSYWAPIPPWLFTCSEILRTFIMTYCHTAIVMLDMACLDLICLTGYKFMKWSWLKSLVAV